MWRIVTRLSKNTHGGVSYASRTAPKVLRGRAFSIGDKAPKVVRGRAFSIGDKAPKVVRGRAFSIGNEAPKVSRETSFSVGDKMHGYVVERVEEIPELCMTAIELDHEGSGAKHLHLARDDPNNCFSVTFRTTPTDSTGVAHILEHLVLCGSQRYPCRDPFMKMTNRSLATFMNAMTWPDATMYPFSSQNQTDFHNLMNVYLDAVFFPNLKYLDFRQEGWRLEHENTNDRNSDIVFKGVVFNEMKGAFSSSSQTYFRYLLKNMYPDLIYANESGGDPLEIPNLTYEDLRAFYARHYHPSNARFFTYGNFPLQHHLSLIEDRVLRKFEKNESFRTSSEVGIQPSWSCPREASTTCAPDSLAPFPERQTTVSLSYKLTSVDDSFQLFLLGILSFLLSHGPNSPFYDSLIASGIGMDYSPGQGHNNFTKESFFSIGLSGVAKDNVDKVHGIILDTFKKAAEEGFSQQRLEVVLHLLEIGQKHQTTSYGLHQAMNLLPTLNHDSDPMALLHFNQRMDKLRKHLQSDPDYLKKKIKEYFVDNQHRLLLVMNPSESYLEEMRKKEKELLSSKVSKLTDDTRTKLYEEGIQLLQEQKREDDSSLLPILNVETDISREMTKPLLVHHRLGDVAVQTSVQESNGINYFKALFRMDHIPDQLVPYFPLFASCLTKVGANKRNHKELDQEILLRTKGLSSSVHISEEADSTFRFEKGIFLASYCLQRNFDAMLSLWIDVINCPKFGEDREHLRQLVKMSAADLSDSISGSGNRFAACRASSSLTPGAKFREDISGLSYAFFLKKISEADDVDQVIDKLDMIRKLIHQKGVLRLSLNAQEAAIDPALKSIEKFVKQVKRSVAEPSSDSQINERSVTGPSSSDQMNFTPSNLKEHHVFNFNTNYVGSALTSVPFFHEDHAVLRIAARLVAAKFLLREVREVGGAYGAGAGLSTSGIFTFSSYRDPRTLATLDKFNEASQWLAKGDFKEDQVQEAILSTFQSVDAPVNPENKGNLTFIDRMSYEQRHEYRLRLLNVKKDHIVRVARKYLLDRTDSSAVVIGPENEEISSTSGWKQVKA